MKAKNKVLFLNLYAYSITGGVEKVSQNFVDAIQQLFAAQSSTHSMHDKPADVKVDNYKAFGGSKLRFIWASIWAALKFETIVLSHINLLLVAKIIRLLSPNKRIILFAHGIEVWRTLAPWKVHFLKRNVEIWAVSHFTKQRMVDLHGLDSSQINVLNNSLSAKVNLSQQFDKPKQLLQRYHLDPSKPILYTLNRLSSTERYKGYDKVIQALAGLKKEGIAFQYLLAGKADDIEQKRIESLIGEENLTNEVQLIGFVNNDELNAHFLLCDVFIMPSTGEGFGVVFIEAAAQGCQLIGGNADGSTDALRNGKLGQMVNPTSIEEIKKAIKTAINDKEFDALQQQQLALQHFGFNNYTLKLKELLN
jgi:phosphatidylinositol alpha-1,6-mannosyltransferase